MNLGHLPLHLPLLISVGLLAHQPVSNALTLFNLHSRHSSSLQPLIPGLTLTTPSEIALSLAQSQEAPNAQLTTLVQFSFGNGAYANSPLTLGKDGNFYGMTSNGGNIAFCPPLGCGTFFKMTPAGKLTTLEIFFDLAFGFLPSGGFALGRDGNFYGSTFAGGGNLDGNILKMTPGGKVTKVVDFRGINGRSPYAGLILANNGTFYGTTQEGGSSNRCSSDGCGTVFQVTPAGKLTTLVNFDKLNGEKPSGRLLQLSDGSFYGTTEAGGDNNRGTVFKLTRTGQFRSLVSFRGRNGKSPQSGLTLGKDQTLYGTTAEGGTGIQCVGGCGTLFKMTPSGELKTLFNFNGKNGSEPIAELTLGKDGNLYGTTLSGGTSKQCTDGCGTIFKITPSGRLTTLINFNEKNGSNPSAAMVIGNDGRFYGTTFLGGKNGAGTVFRLSI
ncbi:MAG: choice-of-anchor tandem repeat GloVer-containing protein [Thermosynechococcaceae cyanobacterium]